MQSQVSWVKVLCVTRHSTTITTTFGTFLLCSCSDHLILRWWLYVGSNLKPKNSSIWCIGNETGLKCSGFWFLQQFQRWMTINFCECGSQGCWRDQGISKRSVESVCVCWSTDPALSSREATVHYNIGHQTRGLSVSVSCFWLPVTEQKTTNLRCLH